METAQNDLTPPVALMEDELRVIVEAYMARHDCAPSTLSRSVFGSDSQFVSKFLKGENYTRDKIAALQDFILADRPPSPTRKGG